MSYPKLLKILFVLAAAATSYAADISGVWTTSYTNQEGEVRHSTLTVKSDGSQFTGTISSPHGSVPIAEASLSGDNISFAVVRKGNGDEVRITFKGKVHENSMQLTMQLRDRTPITMTAIRGSEQTQREGLQ